MRAHIYLGLFISGLLAGWLHAETFEVAGGQTYSGEAVSFGEKGVVIKLEDGSYADRIDWDKFTQETLKKLAANPKAALYLGGYIEPSEEELTSAAKRKEIVIRTDYAKLDRPAKKSVFGSLFGSFIGVLGLLLIYGANIYAAYEVSVFRIQPAALVCGVAAVLPILGPIIFLCMPTVVESKEDIVQEPAREKESYHVGEVVSEEEAIAAAPKLPPAQHFRRGQFTFNRRFFETKFPGFFGMVRHHGDQDMVLTIQSAEGVLAVERIMQVTPNEVLIQSGSGDATIPFSAIQEVVLKHKDA